MIIRLLFLFLCSSVLLQAQTLEEVEAIISKEMQEEITDTVLTFTPSLKDTIDDINSIEILPEGLSQDIDSTLSSYFMEHYISIDSTCVSTDTNIPLTDSVYRARLQALPTLVEMTYNPIVKKYIELYVFKRRGLVEHMLGMSHYYNAIFEEVIDREGAPLELRHLPIIESALNATARSRMGATGLWQFMYTTGKGMGLEINSLIDERCDPYKATEAAVRYLKQLYATYGDWQLAIAAYNCGPGNINKAIRRSGGKRNFWEIYHHLPRETRGYIPAFIAANYIMNYYCEHNMCPKMTRALPVTDTLMTSKNIHFQQIADNLNLPIEQIRLLNPQYRKDIIPGVGQPRALTLPVRELYAFIEHEDSIVKYQAEKLITQNGSTKNPGGSLSKSGTTIHRVRSGETLGHIAQKHNTSVSVIKRLNGLHSDRLRIGQQLLVYDKSPSNSNSSAEQSSQNPGLHIVRSGDNLWTIARKYSGISAEMIKNANKLQSNNLHIGQKLVIPSKN